MWKTGRPAWPARGAGARPARGTGAVRRAWGRRTARPQARDPTPATQPRPPSGLGKPTDRTRPAREPSASRTAASPPGSIVATRNTATDAGGFSTGCDSVSPGGSGDVMASHPFAGRTARPLPLRGGAAHAPDTMPSEQAAGTPRPERTVATAPRPEAPSRPRARAAPCRRTRSPTARPVRPRAPARTPRPTTSCAGSARGGRPGRSPK